MPEFFNRSSLNEDYVIDFIRADFESQFPKSCTACGHLFKSVKEYIENTVHIGQPRSFDADIQDWQPSRPLGTFAFSKCNCGNTLTLCSSSVKDETMRKLLAWFKKEGQRRNVSISELLNNLRTKVEAQVLEKS